jgi:hypothetical protein
MLVSIVKPDQHPVLDTKASMCCVPTLADPDYLAHVLRGRWNARHQKGTAAQRADIKALEVPLMPIAHQQAVVAALRTVDEIREHASATAAAAALTASMLDAVRYGAMVDSDD